MALESKAKVKLLTLSLKVLALKKRQTTNFARSFPIFEKIRYEISCESPADDSHEISCLICYF